MFCENGKGASVWKPLAIVALFFISYAFTVRPIADSPYVPVTCDNFHWEENEYDYIFSMVDLKLFLVDNEDGTFSYYINGIFQTYVDADSDLLQWVEIRARESD